MTTFMSSFIIRLNGKKQIKSKVFKKAAESIDILVILLSIF